MATEVTLPALGESVTEGTVTRWLKQVGDQVAVDEPLLEVSTDKVDTEIPSPVAGTLVEIKANEDDTVEVGAVLALVGDEGEGGDSDESADDSADESADDSVEDSGSEGDQPDEAGGGEDVEQERAEQEAEEKDSNGEAPSEQEPAAESADDSSSDGGDSGDSGDSAGGGGGGTSVTLPALGESVTEGTVTRWLKQVGDDVAVDEPLLEVSTDKVDTEIPSPVAGKLLEIKVEEDETVEVGAELAIVGSGDDAPKQAEPEAKPANEQEAEKKQQQEQEIVEEKDELPAGDETPETEKQEEPEPEKKPEPAAREARCGRVRAREGPGRAVDVRHSPGPQDGRSARRRPRGRVRYRRRGTDPQAGRPGGSQGQREAGRGTRCRGARCVLGSIPGSDAAGQDRADVEAAQGHRQADDGVAADLRPAHPGGRGRRDQHRAAARLGQGRLPCA